MNSLSRGSFSDSYQHFWGPHYELVLNILGSTGIIFPIGDPDFGKSDAATFKSFGEAALTCTPGSAIDGFTSPFDQVALASYQGIIPILNFNGASSSGESIVVTDATEIQNIWDGGGSFTAWFRAESDGGGDLGRLFWKANGSQIFVRDESSSTTNLRFNVDFDSTDGGWITTALEIAVNKWHHLVLVYDSDAVGNNPIFYIDNVAKTVGGGLTEASTPIGTRVSDASVNLVIGNIDDGSRTFDGDVAGGPLGPAICKTSLTADQVSRLYYAGRMLLNV